MEKPRHTTLRCFFGVAFKLNFRQNKPTTVQSLEKKKKDKQLKIEKYTVFKESR